MGIQASDLSKITQKVKSLEYIKNVKTKMDMRHTFMIHNEMFITLPFFHSTMKVL